MDPSRTDVVIAILGASAALAGLVLVFLGLLVNAYQGYPSDTPKSVLDRRKRAIWPVAGVFSLSVVSIGLALAWLAIPGGTCFYRTVVAVFAADLAAIVAVALCTTVRLLR